MATAKHTKYSRLYFDAYRISNWASSTNLDMSRDSVEYTPIEGEYKLFLPGKAGGTSAINGFLDVADDGFDERDAANVLAPSTHYICRTVFAGTSSAAGDIAYETQEFDTGDSRAYDQAGIAMLNWSGQATGGVVRGKVLIAETAVTGTGAVGASLNFGATSANEVFVATIRVVSVSGAGSVTFAIQESSDDGAGDAYATISGMTATFTAVGVSRVSTTSATEAYKIVNATAFSGFTSVTAIVTIGVEAASDV